MEKYLLYIMGKLKELLSNNNFIGKLEIEINIKNGGIVNMNISSRESVKI